MSSTRALFASLVLFAGAVYGCAKGGATNPGEAGGSASTSTSSATTTTSSTSTTQSSTSASSTSASSTSASSAVSSSSSSGAGGAGGAGGGGGMGGMGGAPGLNLGDTCMVDADCASKLCKDVLINSGQLVCVTPCKQQSDCSASSNYFCDPLTPSAMDGYCVPHSPAHCLSCQNDSDCGSLSEVCAQAPGDKDLACHIDCTLSGDKACPAEYSCLPELINGGNRMVCMPNVPTCLDALGGFCDRVTTPQSCTRSNATGTCIGQRTCIAASKRFDTCGASAPQCKTDCSVQDPAGCTLSYCSGATSTPANCGMCGKVCPGLNQPNDNVACNASQMCDFSCQGESYNVNKNKADGCEKTDSPLGNHVQGNAVDIGTLPCDDTMSKINISGKIDSDADMHTNPSINGFNATTGAAPDYFHVFASGGLPCQNDLNVTLQINGSGSPACYQITANTNKGPYACKTNAAGNCPITNGAGSYGDMTDIWFIIEKTCNTNVTEEVTYSVTGHL